MLLATGSFFGRLGTGRRRAFGFQLEQPRTRDRGDFVQPGQAPLRIGVGHSVVYRADIDRIFVTDGSDGDLKIFDGTTYELLKTVKLLADSDATGYDPVT